MPARKFFLFALLLLFSFNLWAQKTDDALKEKRERELKLLEQILSDAKNLRLPENRAIIFAKAGSAFWQTDEKRARALFQDSLTELVAGQNEAQNEKGAKTYLQALIYGQSPRMDIINLVAARDAELALEFLEKSRPAVIAEALERLNDSDGSPAQQYARSEIAVEHRLYGLAADQNPQIAVKRIRESIKKGVNYETLNLLRKIYNKDPQTADKLAAELAENFLSVDFTKNYQTAETIGYFVAEFGRPLQKDEKAVRIPDELLRRLVAKMTDDWLGSKTNQLYGYWNTTTVVERLFPERAAKIKQQINSLNSSNQADESQKYSQLMGSETAPEEMLAQAENFSPAYRNEIYRAAAQKFANGGKIAQAEKIMQTSISDEQSEYYLSQFYTNLSSQLASQGKYDEANDYVNRIPDENQRISALINLASSAYQRDPKENLKLAEGFLTQARALIPDVPETQNEFNAAASLAAAYVPFNADEAFRLLESLLPTLNELVQANFVMMKFRNYGGLRQNEFQIINSGNNLGIYNLEITLRALKEKDFARTLQFVNGINRADTRIWLQMQILNENASFIIDLPIRTRQMISLS